MVRNIYPGTLVQLPNGDPAASTSVTFWDDLVAGNNITGQMLALDGVSSYVAKTDTMGVLPHILGPDGYAGFGIFVDTGASQRFMLPSKTVIDAIVAGFIGSAGGGGTGLATYAQVQNLTDYPTTFPPSPHSHPAGQISDATTVGQALMKAADAQAARVAIGAGTGNGTSSLALGTTATTAAPGNHGHAASGLTFTPTGALTAQTVQDAIVQAAASGGGSGTSQVFVWRYSAGAYPALPTTKPSGVYEVRALGPTYPTTIPSWVGLGASQIPLSYSKVSVG